MPPKRKAATGKGPAVKRGKKAAAEEEAPKIQDHIKTLKAADKGKAKKHKPDSHLSAGYEVHEDYNAMLNQTNIGHNNNKFYIIQVLKGAGNKFFGWNRWGRVGESGQNSMKGPFSNAADAIKDFEKKFSDKTKNKWADREKFVAKPGKYTLLEMAGDDDEEDEVDAGPAVAVKSDQKVAKCTLDATTQVLVKLIFDNDMFSETMKKFDIDVKKMPLGKLSKAQIAKGFEILEDLEEALKKKSPKSKLQEICSQFYTAVPHDFGRTVPPVIDNMETLQQKYDMLAVLGDIEIAQSMQKEKVKDLAVKDEVPHPLDMNYSLLKAQLKLVDPKSNDFKVLNKYFMETKGGGWCNPKLKHIWSVSRDGETNGFKAHDGIKERKLLWHGTSVAVVAAILKTGLRIMPHSGGRVGKGIYFASENSKSAGYVGTAGKAGIMFLNEVAIGKQNIIYADNPNLKQPPKGYDSVLACGTQEPDSKQDTKLTIDGKEVIVPQAKPKPTGHSSSFHQSEYLIYKESQNRIRYLLLFDF